MSRDMKPRRTPAKKKSRGGTLLGLFIGLIIGVLGAAGVVWYINKMPMPFTTKGQTPARSELASNGAPAALPGKPGDPAPKIADKPAEKGSEKDKKAAGDKPRFDFYEILPGKVEAIPDPKPESAAKSKDGDKSDKADKGDKGDKAEKAEKADKTEKAREERLKEPLFLQAGSFQNAGDADNQKAKLAMLGSEASIQQVMVQDKVWYRVRIGPFSKLDEVNRLRADLAKQGVEANVVKKD